MKALLLVGLGGCIGSIARYALGMLLTQPAAHGRFPLGTFAVNVLGCLLAGLLAGWWERQALLSADARLFVFTGLLGGFTTFSAFGLETVALLRRGEPGTAVLYAGGSVALGIAAVWLGLRLVAALPR
jgi:CrcB protein